MTAAPEGDPRVKLKGWIEFLLKEAGFGSYEVFQLSEGYGATAGGEGATVGVAADLDEAERYLLLAAYSVPLWAKGLVVENRSTSLYVTRTRDAQR